MDKYTPNLLFDAGEGSGYARKTDRKRDRHQARMFCRNMEQIGADDALEDSDYCSPVPTYRWDPKDYLVPLNGYLASKVGQEWNKVHSQISAVANKNSMVGDHFWEHVRGYVSEKSTDIYRRYSNFIVDEDGILQEGYKYQRSRYRPERKDRRQAEKWMGYRIHSEGEVEKKVSQYRQIVSYHQSITYFTPRLIRVIGNEIFWMTAVIHPFHSYFNKSSYRQGRKLTKEEREKFNSFSDGSKEFMTWTPERDPFTRGTSWIRK